LHIKIRLAVFSLPQHIPDDSKTLICSNLIKPSIALLKLRRYFVVSTFIPRVQIWRSARGGGCSADWKLGACLSSSGKCGDYRYASRTQWKRLYYLHL